ncbi:MAG TPA: adenylate/guanylate cyclase domain-containing protein [Gaiellaceae bacterium]|nr:adenylate/guanylate cyclase domain-containing protein [Gaiellaceae bacterium]
MRTSTWVAVAVAPLLLIVVLLARPEVDGDWENHPAHFWLVLGAAFVATALGFSVATDARRRHDARLFLISLAFIVSAAFLGMHALATPGVLLGPNAGFELATPVGLLLAGAFAAAASADLGSERAERILRLAPVLFGALGAVVLVWAVVSLAELPPLDDPLADEQLDGWQLLLAALGVALFGLTAFGFLRLHRRRHERFVLAFALAFVLLAEAMVVIAWARNWHVSWWEWHVLMLASFLLIAFVARAEWHEERFSAIYLDETLAGTREVSVVFADLAGYTSFAERHTPEDVAAMLNSYYERIIPIMERAGGEVHQIVGDELMVIFGKDATVEDHAHRAARAALVLQRVAHRVAADEPDWPRFRVGVASGEVHAGVVGAARGHRKHGIVGDVVNLAARLQAAAPVEGVLISETTFRALGTRTVVEAMAPLSVKGKREPVTAYILHRLAREPADGD